MIIRAAGLDLPVRLEVEELGERTAFCSVEVLLHQGQSDPRAARELTRELHCRLDQIDVRHHPIHHSQR